MTAAQKEKKSPSACKRGGKSSWKCSVRRRYNRDLRRQKQRKQRRQAVNRQIWQRLQALVPRAEETATSLLQLAETVEERTRIHRPGEELLDKAMAGQHWVAIGGDEAQEMTNAGRKIKDGILLRVTVSIAGRNCVALIDSGASQSYIAPETVTLCEVDCSPALVHLELADGSKVQSTQQTLAVSCTVGKAVCKISFTVTKLLSNVDVVLGMDWLKTWNPVIDWRKQKMYIWVQGEWDHVNGILLESEQKVGTVKVFDDYLGDVTCAPDFTVIKEPKLWTFKSGQKEKKVNDVEKGMHCTITGDKTVQKKTNMNTVQEGK